jgi:hypothetical protein
MVIINPTQLLAFFHSIGRRLQIWMDESAANPRSRPAGAEGVKGRWHDVGIAESKVRTLAERWPDSPQPCQGGWRVSVLTKRYQRAVSIA